MSDKIEPGDFVRVNNNTIGMTLFSDVEVIHVPQATGDHWIFKDGTGGICYFNEPATIYRIRCKP